MMKKKPFKIGFSKGIILPSDFCKQLNIKLGTELELRLENDEILIRPIRSDANAC